LLLVTRGYHGVLYGEATMTDYQTAKPSGEPGPSNGHPAPRPLSSGEMTTALVHLYRAEVGRAVSWRGRLDVTTNWAVVTTGAGMTFALGDPQPQRHVVILLSSVLMTFFLFFEARRYRHYDLWQHRVHLIERAYYAALLDPAAPQEQPGWQKELADDMRGPQYHISFVEAVGWRLWRNYLWLYLANLLIWFVKIGLHPEPLASLAQFLERAQVGPLPGHIVLLIGLVFNGALVGITVYARHKLACEPDILRC